jgi:glycosyltransferase involved in cell wall biosynthesis
VAERTPTTLASFGPADRLERRGPLVIRVFGRPWRVRGQEANPFALGLFPELARHDVIHLHQQHLLTSSLAALAGRFLGKRVFVTDLGGGGWDLSAYVNTDRWFHGHLHLSAYSRGVFGHSGKPWARVIWGGVDTDRFSPAPGGLPTRDRPVLFVGRLVPHKGVEGLIDALPPGMALEVIGRPYHAQYFRDLQARAAGKRVAFLTDVADADLPAAYRRALCVVLPSVYRDCYGQETRVPELLGQTLLEGMACGIPAIATAVASLPEVVVDGETGFVVPPHEPAALRQRLERLHGDPALADRLGQGARVHVLARFTWPAVVDRCLAAYESNRATVHSSRNARS